MVGKYHIAFFMCHNCNKEWARIFGINQCPNCEWQPTPANINALPEKIREYIHHLEANCDPAGTVQDVAILKDQVRDLGKALRMLRDNQTEEPLKPKFEVGMPVKTPDGIGVIHKKEDDGIWTVLHTCGLQKLFGEKKIIRLFPET
jgi:hypothetical protein